jgi:mannose-6-phosphate isomerase
MSELPPLRFRPILREYLWGGRRLGTELGKPIGDGDHYAESWEVVDHGKDQSIVDGGLFAGATLHELVARFGRELCGYHQPQQRFPLLLKFLDARQTLSVQVHPNDMQAARLSPPDLGKTEAWIVLDADPGSMIYAGLKPGVDRARLEQALAAGRCDECLHQVRPRVGDCILIEAGTVHAIGAGLLIAEIQQASDTTYRLFDWNRVDRDGRPRELHIEQAMGVIDFNRGPVNPAPPEPTDRPYIERLVKCDRFVVDRWNVSEPVTLSINERFHILAMVQGNLKLRGDGDEFHLHRGDSLLIPANCEHLEMDPQGKAGLLDMYLP